MADISKIKLSDNTIYDIKDTKARENIAPTFSTSESYNIGAVVLYNGTLYKCILPHTAGAWNSEHFEETTITAQINSSEENTTYSLSGTTASDVTTITLTGSDGTTTTASVDISGKANTSDLTAKENTSNKVTSLSLSSTDTQYPSAKCVYNELQAKQSEIDNLEQDVEDLRNASYKVPGTGTDITLNNTAQGRLLKNDLSGRTEQVQLAGKNLLDWNKFIDYANWNKSESSDYRSYELQNLKPNVEYTLSRNNDSGLNTGKYAGFNPTNSNANMFIHNTASYYNKQNITATANEDGKLYITFYMGNVTQLQEYIELIGKCWVVEGSTATSYEPYCGGIPSPNPGYPQQIKNVTGNANVKIQNSFIDWAKFSNLSNWENATSSGYKAFKITGLKPLTTYTFCRTDNEGYGHSIYACFNNAINNTNRFISAVNSSECLKSVSATSTSNGELYVTMTPRYRAIFSIIFKLCKKCLGCRGYRI